MSQKYDEASSLYKKAHSLLEQGDSENAMKHYCAAIELLRDVDERDAQARALKALSVLGEFVHVRITDIVLSNDYEEKIIIIEDICVKIINELRSQRLSEARSSFLLDHGPQIQIKIKDKQLRERNVWVG